MKTKQRACAVLFLLVLGFSLTSCSAGRSSRSVSPISPTAKNPEVSTDVALGTLPLKGKTEAEKQKEELESESSAEEALEETRQRELQEEQRRIQRSITDFAVTDQQVRQ